MARVLRTLAAALGIYSQLCLAAQDINGAHVTVLSDNVPVDSPNTYWSQLQKCPRVCKNQDASQWDVYSSLDELSKCNEPLLLSYSLFNPVDKGTNKINACRASDTGSKKKRASNDCLHNPSEKSVSITASHLGSPRGETANLLETIRALHWRLKDTKCDISSHTSYSNDSIVGLYTGSEIDKNSILSLLDTIASNIEKNGATSHSVYQLCDKSRNGNQMFGLSIGSRDDLRIVQKDLVSWTEGKCVDASSSGANTFQAKIRESTYPVIPSSFNDTAVVSNVTSRDIAARGTCRTIDVVANDNCGLLASRCGISGPAFERFNPGENFCSKLVPDQRVCCTSGGLPDIRPTPGEDGSCSALLIQEGQNCARLSAHYGISKEDIESWNKGGVWGWSGCERIRSGDKICLSKGTPPMPAPYDNAVCGPVVRGSKLPNENTKLEDLNPCPLNACCNIWGQCGISGDFCKDERGPTGNPGTAPPGVDGCISSCGTDIVGTGRAPASYGRVGYYETWNFDRECLNMKAENSNPGNAYSIIHWAFAELNTNDWTVKIKDPYHQWESFKALKNVKRVISFGGWAFSNEPGTYDILRQAVSNEHRSQFSKNVAKFIHDEGLDGVDIDWEYPGAKDIPGTPPGRDDDGENYFKTLSSLRSELGEDRKKTLSIAAPASFWYLKNFPIKQMALMCDYIVYMTYDLHGQWDVGNKHSMDGCLEGNCLRSHVNLTETKSSLAMITKAGVPTYKIFVGEASYGRSFKMAQAGCVGFNCRFLGDRNNSLAKPGRCTNTGGYISNVEIQEIIDTREKVTSYFDVVSHSNILVYDDTEWVAYMDEHTKETRRKAWRTKNFAGTIDWAVDLQQFTIDDFLGADYSEDDFFPDENKPLEKCTGEYDNLDNIPQDAPWHCQNMYILMVLRKTIQDSMKQYDDLIAGGYTKKFNTYAEAVARSGRVQIEKFTYKHGKDYFDCVVTERYSCCKICYGFGGDDKQCRFCEDFKCNYDPVCAGNPEISCPEVEYRFKNITTACPPDFSGRSEKEPEYNWVGNYALSTVYWKLREDRKDAFYTDLFNETGIDIENVGWANVRRTDCLPTEKKEDCWHHGQDVNFPVPVDYEKDDVINPDIVISRGYDKLKDLGDQLTLVIDQLKNGVYAGSSHDVVDAVALTVQVAEDAVDNMQTIDDKVDEWEEEKRKNIILAFLTAIFLFIPIIGEAAAAFGVIAGATRIAVLAGGVAGNVALDIYSIVDEPENAPLIIFGLVLEPFALLDVAKITKAANVRRGMSPEDVKKLHAKPNSKIDKINEINNVCRAPKRKRFEAMEGIPMSSLSGIQYHKW